MTIEGIKLNNYTFMGYNLKEHQGQKEDSGGDLKGIGTGRHQILTPPIVSSPDDVLVIKSHNKTNYTYALPGLALSAGVVITAADSLRKLWVSKRKLLQMGMTKKQYALSSVKKNSYITVGISLLALAAGIMVDSVQKKD